MFEIVLLLSLNARPRQAPLPPQAPATLTCRCGTNCPLGGNCVSCGCATNASNSARRERSVFMTDAPVDRKSVV